MSLPEPNIDDRNYEQILDEALARIPVHTPLWTNYNDSDPGVTILQVFAFMVESLQYRANRIPERNRRKFLNLLGIHRRPATAAEGLVTFASPSGPLQVDTLSSDRVLTAGSVPFRTQSAVDVLPLEAQVFYKADPQLSSDAQAEADTVYGALFEGFAEENEQLNYYETRQLEPPVAGAPLPEVDLNEDTVNGDQSLWVALLARPGDANRIDDVRDAVAGAVCSIAIVPALRAEERNEEGVQPPETRELPPRGQTPDDVASALIFETPQVTEVPPTAAAYQQLDVLKEDDVLAEPGLVNVRLPDRPETWTAFAPTEEGTGNFPPSVEETDVADRIITWIRIRPRLDDEETRSRKRLRISYVGINAAKVRQRARALSEFVGQGTGRPDQTVSLVNTPVLPDRVILTVNGQRWRRVDDLAAAPPEVPRRSLRRTTGDASRATTPEEARVFTLDPATGEIRFGDGLRGARPPRGSVIQASYEYGGGRDGVVGIGALTAGSGLPPGIRATNPIPTYGGAEAETVAQAEKRIPGELRRRDRLVSAGDFADVTRGTPGVDIGRVEVLPLVHPSEPSIRAAGVVTVLVLPATDPDQPDAPQPDRLFLDAVCEHLDPRRLITTEVHVVGPSYQTVHVGVGVEAVPGRDLPPIREAVRDAVKRFLSPFTGGFSETGWPLGRAVRADELLAVAARIDGVARVNGVTLCRPDDTSAQTEVGLDDLQLPRLGALRVQAGSPPSADELTGGATGAGSGAGSGDGARPAFVPVPITPENC
jgi:hypothetical protein